MSFPLIQSLQILPEQNLSIIQSENTIHTSSALKKKEDSTFQFEGLDSKIRAGIKNNVGRKLDESRSLNKAARLTYIYGEAHSSVSNLVEAVTDFCKWMGSDPDRIVAKSNYRHWHDVLNNYSQYLYSDRKSARSVIRRRVGNVRKWLEVNGVVFHGRVFYPREWNVEKDSIPSRQELKKILGKANLRDRVLALISLSSGLRPGSICRLKIKHIALSDSCPIILVPPELAKNRPSSGYISFMTPEAKKFLRLHLKEREKQLNEKITPDSYVLGNYSYPGSPFKSRNVQVIWRNCLRRAKMDRKITRFHQFHFNTLRKFFLTWTKLSGVEPFVAESFMGHKDGIHQIYFYTGIYSVDNPLLMGKLRREYEKAIPALTILSNRKPIRFVERYAPVFVKRESTGGTKTPDLQEVQINDLTGIESSQHEQALGIGRISNLLEEIKPRFIMEEIATIHLELAKLRESMLQIVSALSSRRFLKMMKGLVGAIDVEIIRRNRAWRAYRNKMKKNPEWMAKNRERSRAYYHRYLRNNEEMRFRNRLTSRKQYLLMRNNPARWSAELQREKQEYHRLHPGAKYKKDRLGKSNILSAAYPDI